MLISEASCLSVEAYCSFTKNRRSHSHAGRSFFNRHFEVMRHAHRKNIHSDRRQFARGDRIAQVRAACERKDAPPSGSSVKGGTVIKPRNESDSNRGAA